MNSFKKIALAVVAAMTLGTLVVTPASANTVSVAVTTKADAADTGSATVPLTVNVPFDNVISDTAVTTSEVLTLTATVVSGTPVTFAVTGNAKLLTTLTPAPNSASGVSSLTVTPASTTAVAYLYTTSTAASAVTVSVLGASTTLYVKGIAGPAYNVTLSVPTSGNIGGVVTATATVTDIFGNAKATAPTFTAINATAAAAVADSLVVGKYTSLVTLSTNGSAAVGVSITAPTAVPTLATAITSASAIVSTVDLAGALAAANAALAAEKVASAAALAAEKAAAAKALADAKAATDAEILVLKAEVVTLKADAVTAKVAADKALSDTKAAAKVELDAVKAENAKALADANASIAAMKKAFNALAKKWNVKNPTAKVTLVK